MIIGRSDGRQAFSNQEGIGSRLQHLLLDFFMIHSISLIDAGEKSDKLYWTIGGGDSVEAEGELSSVLWMILILSTKKFANLLVSSLRLS